MLDFQIQVPDRARIKFPDIIETNGNSAYNNEFYYDIFRQLEC